MGVQVPGDTIPGHDDPAFHATARRSPLAPPGGSRDWRCVAHWPGRGAGTRREPPAWHIPTRCGRSNPGKANGGCPSPWRWLGAPAELASASAVAALDFPVSLGHHRGVGRQPPAQPGVWPACVGGGGFMADLDLHQSSREGHAALRRGRRESGLDTRARKPTAGASSVAWHFVMRSRLAGGVVGGGLTGR